MPAAPDSGLYLGFDYGERRIGVAVGNHWSCQARPLGVLTHDSAPPWEDLQALIDQWRPQALIVGLPLNHDGFDQDITTRTRRFAEELEQRYQLPVYTQDERWTSTDAASRLKGARQQGRIKRRLRKGDKDSMAAQLILEDFLGVER